MNQSNEINELAAALAKAQSEVEKSERDGSNPHFRSRYSGLGAVWDAIREPMTKHGISTVQFPSTDFEHQAVVIRTRVIHASGQWMEDCLSIPVSKWDAQGVGSAMTYGRRYSLMAVAGVAPNDDDGEAAVGRAEKPKTAAKPAEKITTERAAAPVSERAPAGIYPKEKFDANLPAWIDMVKSGKKTAEGLIATLETKTSLTNAQKQQIIQGAG